MFYTEWKYYPNLQDCYKIRTKVFIEEQMVSREEEPDEYDAVADHVVVYEQKQPIAAGRLVIKEEGFMLGRIAVLPEHRGLGYGDLVVRLLVRRAFDLGAKEVYLHAQTHAVAFYEKLGFKTVGEKFIEAGIEHIEMRCNSDITGNCGK